MKQKRLSIRLLMLIICISMVLSSHPYHSYGATNITPQMSLPQFRLDVSDPAEIKQYLGLKNLKSFTISQIPSKLILIEIFSLYCPICHKQAPIANKLYKFIQQDPKLSKDIKMIGIGAGNNQKEIEAYKTKFRTPFPLFCDPDFNIHKKIGEPRTPFTILVTNKGKVLFTHSGIVEDLDQFLSLIRKFHEQTVIH
jgi:thiol-disulfide isomerase/thioredoxin